MKIKEFTIKQLMIAAAISRGLSWKRTLQDIGITGAYLSKCQNDSSIILLVNDFKKIKPDEDTKDYKGPGTLLMMIGQLIYKIGEIQNVTPTEG